VVLGVSLPLYSSFAYAPITLFGTDFQPSSTRLIQIWNAPRPRRPNLRFRLVRFRSPLLPQSRLFSSPRLTKMFQFSRCPPHALCIQARVTTLNVAGFPHSDSHGSKLACSSPWRFAAGRVLLRHVAPRHPPCALNQLSLLSSLICSFQSTISNRGHRRQNTGDRISKPQTFQHLSVWLTSTMTGQPYHLSGYDARIICRQKRSITYTQRSCQNLK
jgi:hypothetical protein